MKKFLLSAALVASAFAASAEDYYLVGAFNNWENPGEVAFVEQDGKYVAEVASLEIGGGFKITNGTWDETGNWGSNGEALVLGEAYTLAPNGANLLFARGVLSIENAVLTLTPGDEYTLVVTGTATIDPNLKDWDDLYLMGTITSWDFAAEQMFEYDQNEKVYVLKNVELACATDGGEYKIAGNGWNPNFGSNGDDPALELNDSNSMAHLVKGSNPDNCPIALDGTYNIYFELDADGNGGTVEIIDAGEDSVASIAADNNEAVVYYNLQGVEVANPANGLYIVKQGSKVSKMLVK